MRVGIIFASVIFLFAVACSLDYKSAGKAPSHYVDPRMKEADLVVDQFSFEELFLDENNLSFYADRAFYYEGESLLFFKNVKGVYSAGRENFSFTLPEAVYDSEHKQLVALSSVTMSTEGGMTVTSRGGVFDFYSDEVSLERDVVITSRSMVMRGEQGEVDLETGRVRLWKVNATVKSVEGVRREVEEVVR